MNSPSTESEWRRPGQIMKIHRRKKRDSLQNDGNLKQVWKNEAAKDPISTRDRPAKRRNPFSCPSELPLPKKHNAEVGNVVDSTSDQPETNNGKPALLLDILESTEKVSGDVESFTPAGNHTEISDQNITTATMTEERQKPERTSDSVQVDAESRKVKKVLSRWNSGTQLPQDWSLKQKCRFMSEHSFAWCSSLKSLDEAEGINIFITQQQTNDYVRRELQFQRCIMYWIHPNLPWVKLFPRFTSDNNRVSRASLTTTDDDVLLSLRQDWAESFTSAFHLVRANFSSYFYLCAPQFTVLFQASRTQGETIQAMVTPTTRGFREALTNDGIEFTLPLFEDQNPDTGKTLSVDDDVDNSDHTAASVWLESIGLNKTEFPSLNPQKVKLQREHYRAIDNRPQSLVMVQGTNVQAFFNFLLNWRSCVASSGPQTGLPPTILSPDGFKGATLHSLKVKQSMIKQAGEDGSLKECGVLELTGPILPHSLSSLCELFKSDCEFTATLNNHDTTTPFNSASLSSHKNQIKGCEESESKAELVNGAFKELEYSSNLFHWMT